MFFSTGNKNSHVSVNGVNPFFQSTTNVYKNVIFLLHLGNIYNLVYFVHVSGKIQHKSVYFFVRKIFKNTLISCHIAYLLSHLLISENIKNVIA